MDMSKMDQRVNIEIDTDGHGAVFLYRWTVLARHHLKKLGGCPTTIADILLTMEDALVESGTLDLANLAELQDAAWKARIACDECG